MCSFGVVFKWLAWVAGSTGWLRRYGLMAVRDDRGADGATTAGQHSSSSLISGAFPHLGQRLVSVIQYTIIELFYHLAPRRRYVGVN